MNGLVKVVLVLGLVGVVVMACTGLAPVPSGAQQVHVTSTDSELHLQPATVQAGDVYVVLDGPRQSVEFVSRKSTAEETPGSMTDDELTRLAGGDTEGTSIEGISVGCSAAQRAAARGQVGYCGNVYKFALVPGKYAFLLDSPEGGPPELMSAGTMAVLEVTP